MKFVPTAITRTVGHAVLKTQKNSPTILFVAGLAGVVTATVLACKATLKLEEHVENTRKDLIDAEVLRSRNSINDEQYDATKRQIIIKGTWDIAKIYAPAVGVGVIAIACLTQSHRTLTQRNTALTAAYVGLQQFLEGYRGRVREEIGTDRERDVYYASSPVELVEDDGEKGMKKVYGSRPNGMSPYSAIFDERSTCFQDAGEYNISFIKIQEQLLTDKLRAQGYLFLNDVYKVFDIPITQTGQICGWMIPHPLSDDFVEIKYQPLHDFHQSLVLDFNVAGVVYDMLDDGQMSR